MSVEDEIRWDLGKSWVWIRRFKILSRLNKKKIESNFKTNKNLKILIIFKFSAFTVPDFAFEN